MPVRNGLLAAAAAGLLCAGCASQGERPTAEITRAQTLIDQAEKSGAQQYAAQDLQQAREKMKLADAAVEDGRNEEARARAVEAAADADLAAARAATGRAQRAAEEVRQSTEMLRQEANRGTPQQQSQLPQPSPQSQQPPLPQQP